MASFFISHSSGDASASERVRDRLKAGGYESVFLDFDPADGIPAGRDWEHELYVQLRRADAVIFLGSSAALDSKWCFAELALARATGKPIFPIALEPKARHPLLADRQWVDLDGEGDAAFERLWNAFQGHGFDPRDAFAWDPSRAPFPGLSPLEAEDAAVFFGRGAEVDELVSRLQPILGSSGRLIALIGPSGSGKSSLVRAGLVPRLRRMGPRWVVVPPLRPGTRPLTMLARRLGAALGESDWKKLRDRLERKPSDLVAITDDLLDHAESDAASALLVIDQAEELVNADVDERATFLEALGTALQESSSLWVVATLRSEYLTGLLQEPAVANVVGPAIVLGPLGRTHVPEVVEGPARRAGLDFDPGLVGRIVEDAGDGEALPLLAYTLRLLYDRAGEQGRITTKDYEAIGGVLGALRGRADAIADELGRSGRGDFVIPTLLKFASIEQENEPIGRRVLRRDLVAGETEVVDAFIDARLLTTGGEGDEATVGVAHDSLLRSWAPLRQAIDSSRDDLRLRSELEHLAHEWDSVGRSSSYLLREDRLAAASALLESEIGDVAPVVQEFVERSTRQSQAVLQRESDLLARRVLESLEEEPQRSLLLARAAVEEYFPTPRAIRALNAALVASRVRLLIRGHDGSVSSAGFSPDGTRIVTSSMDRTARVCDAASGEELLVLQGHEDAVYGAAFSPDGHRIVTAAGDGTARVWDAASGQELQVLRGHTDPPWTDAVKEIMGPQLGPHVWSGAFSPDRSLLVTAASDWTARVWDAYSGEELQVLRGHEGGVLNAAFSSDGAYVVTASDDKTARVWDAGSGDELQVLAGHEATVNDASFSPDVNLIVTASNDGTARVWSSESGELVAFHGHDGNVMSVAFSPDGSSVVTASEDGTARVWTSASGEEQQVLRGHAALVNSASFSPDGSLVVTASDDGTTQVWDWASGDELVLLGHEDRVVTAAFSADGIYLVTGSDDTTARVWDAATGDELGVLAGHEEEVNGAVFSLDGTMVATASGDGTARVWDQETGERLAFLGHDGEVRSAAFSPDGNWIVTASEDGTARVWSSTSAEELHVLRHGDEVNDASYSPDGSLIVTASDDGTARVWDAATGEERRVLRDESDRWVRSASFSTDGNLILIGSVEDLGAGATPTSGRARVWSTATGEQLHVLYDDWLYTAAFSPDGSRIVTAVGGGTNPDGRARVRDLSGEELQVLRGPAGMVGSASYAPDGTRIVTASTDGTARVWESLPVDLLLAKANTRAVRALTEYERAAFGLPPAPPADAAPARKTGSGGWQSRA
jgi:WD40 repeat protein